ncbi:2603_t:CDS:2, partial [Acaulospora morrowiae]
CFGPTIDKCSQCKHDQQQELSNNDLAPCMKLTERRLSGRMTRPPLRVEGKCEEFECPKQEVTLCAMRRVYGVLSTGIYALRVMQSYALRVLVAIALKWERGEEE